MATRKKPVPIPNPEQIQALRDFRDRHGRFWKRELQELWITGADANQPNGGLLRQVRNNFGPLWLHRHGEEAIK